MSSSSPVELETLPFCIICVLLLMMMLLVLLFGVCVLFWTNCKRPKSTPLTGLAPPGGPPLTTPPPASWSTEADEEAKLLERVREWSLSRAWSRSRSLSE